MVIKHNEKTVGSTWELHRCIATNATSCRDIAGNGINLGLFHPTGHGGMGTTVLIVISQGR